MGGCPRLTRTQISDSGQVVGRDSGRNVSRATGALQSWCPLECYSRLCSASQWRRRVRRTVVATLSLSDAARGILESRMAGLKRVGAGSQALFRAGGEYEV